MAVILVVDDSSMDRALIAQLLKGDSLDWIVEFADSAEEALVRLNDLAVDVIVSDIMMPGMDGLELLGVIRRRFRGIPVVLTTGQGNESVAVKALRGGASSYVPKDELKLRLTETIKQVLQVAHSQRNYDRLLEGISDARLRLQLSNDPGLIPPLVDLIQQLAKRMQLCSPDSCQQLAVAFDEALINAMYHGNLDLPRNRLGEVRQQLRDGETVDIVEERLSETPYDQRRVFVEVALSPVELEIKICDEGRGFDPQSVATPVRNDGDSATGDSHRGLVLIRSIMDKVEFNEAGNEIRMIKRREADAVDSES